MSPGKKIRGWNDKNNFFSPKLWHDLRGPIVEVCAKECQMSFDAFVCEMSFFSTFVTDNIFQVPQLLSGLVSSSTGYAVTTALGVLNSSRFVVCNKFDDKTHLNAKIN